MEKTSKGLSRRGFVAGAAGLGAAVTGGMTGGRSAAAETMTGMEAIAGGAKRLGAVPGREPDFRYEVALSEAEWEARLTAEEFYILRQGGTEVPKSSPLWNETRAGLYRCKGCGLLNYSGDQKVVLDKGWVFFEHSEPDAVLTGLDRHEPRAGSVFYMMEAHCRRCGSHLGHIVSIDNKVLHCINGLSLTFKPA